MDDAEDNAEDQGGVRFHAFDGSADALTFKCLGESGYLRGAAEKLGVDIVREMDSELGGPLGVHLGVRVGARGERRALAERVARGERGRA